MHNPIKLTYSHLISFPLSQIPFFTIPSARKYVPLPCCFPSVYSLSYFRPSAQLLIQAPCLLVFKNSEQRKY